MKTKKFEVSIEVGRTFTKIYINRELHLSFKNKDLVGIQSWIEGDNDNSFFIEYTFKKNVITSEYNASSKWKKVLSLINEKIK